MKELILVRHAKSDWGNEFLKDIDRPLSERGYQDAYIMSQWYGGNRQPPDLLVASPATRAFNTALIFLREMNLPLKTLHVEDHIYESNANALLKVIKEQDKSAERIMIFGHNPGFTDLANQLSDDLFFENVPTCGIVSFTLDIKKWQAAEFKTAKLSYYQFPKDFRNIP